MKSDLKLREVDNLIEAINRHEAGLLVRRKDGSVELAGPEAIAEKIGLISVLLQQTIDPISVVDRNFRQLRAAKFDKNLKDGMKKTPAMDILKMDPELIDLEVDVNRFNAFLKRTEQVVTVMQTNIRVKTGIAANAY